MLNSSKSLYIQKQSDASPTVNIIPPIVTLDKMYPSSIIRKSFESILPPIDVRKYWFAKSLPFSTLCISFEYPIKVRTSVNRRNPYLPIYFTLFPSIYCTFNLIIRSLINPTNIPATIGSKEISVNESETLNTRKSILAINPIIYSNIIVPNDAINGIQKGLLTTPPPHDNNLLYFTRNGISNEPVKLIQRPITIFIYSLLKGGKINEKIGIGKTIKDTMNLDEKAIL